MEHCFASMRLLCTGRPFNTSITPGAQRYNQRSLEPPVSSRPKHWPSIIICIWPIINVPKFPGSICLDWSIRSPLAQRFGEFILACGEEHGPPRPWVRGLGRFSFLPQVRTNADTPTPSPTKRPPPANILREDSAWARIGLSKKFVPIWIDSIRQAPSDVFTTVAVQRVFMGKERLSERT